MAPFRRFANGVVSIGAWGSGGVMSVAVVSTRPRFRPRLSEGQVTEVSAVNCRQEREETFVIGLRRVRIVVAVVIWEANGEWRRLLRECHTPGNAVAPMDLQGSIGYVRSPSDFLQKQRQPVLP
ncbi:hypothetical protein GGTG_13580 [Gaeumannomyces tritici R3-111a-1]|uniref:Uncharacterized protein n=1 Tax=Gaeumannomyces tritici (strain R3-111a-1) TaxID=644352 RepID=J3PJ99_GAET3|nr:hypothetical protein GGTG_13580 [Gaeumannomyces tritici R3-111a-1]EJT68850.1 hypothetical protein GGTG_13580 [Gaeumannomyces tritici R3-111a-1]